MTWRMGSTNDTLLFFQQAVAQVIIIYEEICQEKVHFILGHFLMKIVSFCFALASFFALKLAMSDRKRNFIYCCCFFFFWEWKWDDFIVTKHLASYLTDWTTETFLRQNLKSHCYWSCLVYLWLRVEAEVFLTILSMGKYSSIIFLLYPSPSQLAQSSWDFRLTWWLIHFDSL